MFSLFLGVVLILFEFLLFTFVALIAHILVWQWRPWLPGPEGYSAIVEGVKVAASKLLTTLT